MKRPPALNLLHLFLLCCSELPWPILANSTGGTPELSTAPPSDDSSHPPHLADKLLSAHLGGLFLGYQPPLHPPSVIIPKRGLSAFSVDLQKLEDAAGTQLEELSEAIQESTDLGLLDRGDSFTYLIYGMRSLASPLSLHTALFAVGIGFGSYLGMGLGESAITVQLVMKMVTEFLRSRRGITANIKRLGRFLATSSWNFAELMQTISGGLESGVEAAKSAALQLVTYYLEGASGYSKILVEHQMESLQDLLQVTQDVEEMIAMLREARNVSAEWAVYTILQYLLSERDHLSREQILDIFLILLSPLMSTKPFATALDRLRLEQAEVAFLTKHLFNLSPEYFSKTSLMLAERYPQDTLQVFTTLARNEEWTDKHALLLCIYYRLRHPSVGISCNLSLIGDMLAKDYHFAKSLNNVLKHAKMTLLSNENIGRADAAKYLREELVPLLLPRFHILLERNCIDTIKIMASLVPSVQGSLVDHLRPSSHVSPRVYAFYLDIVRPNPLALEPVETEATPAIRLLQELYRALSTQTTTYDLSDPSMFRDERLHHCCQALAHADPNILTTSVKRASLELIAAMLGKTDSLLDLTGSIQIAEFPQAFCLPPPPATPAIAEAA